MVAHSIALSAIEWDQDAANVIPHFLRVQRYALKPLWSVTEEAAR
jgi:hypothetical protein